MKLRIRSAYTSSTYFEAPEVKTVYINEDKVKVSWIDVFGDILTVTTDKTYEVDTEETGAVWIEKEETKDAKQD